jgi:hypothetical protein
MTINTQYLKVSAGKTEVEKPFEMGQDLSLTIKGEIVKIDYLNNQDNTVDVVYTLKAREVDVL